MSWFRKKKIRGKFYWYFVERINGKEVSHYIGDDQAVKTRLLPNEKTKISKSEEISFYPSPR